MQQENSAVDQRPNDVTMEDEQPNYYYLQSPTKEYPAVDERSGIQDTAASEHAPEQQAYQYDTSQLHIYDEENDFQNLKSHPNTNSEEEIPSNNNILGLFHIPQEVMTENPQFCKLLSIISDHISPESGIRKEEEKELKRLESLLEREKQKYFQNLIILDTVRDMIDNEIEYRYDNPKLYSYTLHHEGPVNIYGIDPQQRNQSDDSSFANDVQQLVIPELERRLELMYQDLSQFYQPFPNQHTSIFVTDTTNSQTNQEITLTHLVKRHLNQIAQEKESILAEKQNLHQYIFTYFSKMNQYLQILCTLLDNYKCGSFRQYDESTISWLVQRTEAMKLKLTSIKFEYLASTYNKQTVPILYQMYNVLDSTFEQLQTQSSHMDAEIKKYTSLGDEFDKLVEEFGVILKKIHEKQWEIEQLQTPND
ncbi:hypothetical protein C9374_002062 [Naegleria lovaniensis]|uniref:Uncharacterized protein n=1 Tax=Naegleria lovaniensis TaxID=51637 RepID=A0AA88KR48_NAELO|nr:uncharacterized protein C9374_002062 [Naegleria lovaniensis]KAG2387027.1 hypothetical protein C9374_002062 [Naegleria lovaniensis]